MNLITDYQKSFFEHQRSPRNLGRRTKSLFSGSNTNEIPKVKKYDKSIIFNNNSNSIQSKSNIDLKDKNLLKKITM